jgi:hypothetical protein
MTDDQTPTPSTDKLVANLTYFRRSGKYYCEGTLEVDASRDLFKIWEDIRALRNACRLPGLIEGHSDEYIVSVDVPGHKHEHPHLIV